MIEDELVQNIVNTEKKEYRTNQPILSALMLQGLVDDLFDPSEEVAWLCAHCLDLPNETECMELSKMKTHLSLT